MYEKDTLSAKVKISRGEKVKRIRVYFLKQSMKTYHFIGEHEREITVHGERESGLGSHTKLTLEPEI